MKNVFLFFLCLWCSIFSVGAQNLKRLIVEEVREPVQRPPTECESDLLGGLLFMTGIEGLQFDLNLYQNLEKVTPNKERNEIMLCVKPTSSQYIINITGPGYETLDFTVSNIKPNSIQYFRLRTEEPPPVNVNAEDLNKLGKLAIEEKNFTDAEKHFRSAIDLDANNPEYLRNLGNALIKQDKHAAATTFLERAAKIRPNNAETHHLLGTAFLELGRYTDAANSFKAAVDLASNNTQYRTDLQRAMNAPVGIEKAKGFYNMGNAYMAQYNYAEALKYYKDATQADPQNTSYQTAVRTAETRVNQEQRMKTVETAYRKAKATPKPSTSSQTAQDTYKNRYQPMFDEITRVKALGVLPKYMQESIAFYELDAQADLAGGYKNVSAGWLKDFLVKNPETPFRQQIEKEITVNSRIFRGEFGVGVVYNNLLGYSGLLGLRIFSCEQLVNVRIGLQYTYYTSDFYNTADGGAKSESDKTWNINANQLSLPVTLQFNVARMGMNTSKPSSVFIAATVQPNYNLSSTCFGETKSDFVEKFGYSGAVSIGYSTKMFSINVFARKNFTDLFKRDKIYEFDNHNTKNDYSKLDKCLENKLLFGASVGYYF